jgi:hypothetical protein
MLSELMEHATEQPTIQFAVRGVIHGAEYAEKICQSGPDAGDNHMN